MGGGRGGGVGEGEGGGGVWEVVGRVVLKMDPGAYPVAACGLVCPGVCPGVCLGIPCDVFVCHSCVACVSVWGMHLALGRRAACRQSIITRGFASVIGADQRPRVPAVSWLLRRRGFVIRKPQRPVFT